MLYLGTVPDDPTIENLTADPRPYELVNDEIELEPRAELECDSSTDYALLREGADEHVATSSVKTPGELAGFWGDAAGAIVRAGGYVLGGAPAAAALAEAVSPTLRDPQAVLRWQQAMAQARTVSEQLAVFDEVVVEMEVALGRELTLAELTALERRVFGPQGAPRTMFGGHPAVSGGGVPGWLLPVGLAVGIWLLTRRPQPSRPRRLW